MIWSPAITLLVIGLAATAFGLILFTVRDRARRIPGEHPHSSPHPKSRVVTRWSVVAVGALALLSLAMGIEGIERNGMTHVELYVPGITLPADISEPPPRLDLLTTLDWHLHWEPHPPGYFALMWFWTKLAGTGLTALRMPSVVFGVASVILIFVLAVDLYRNAAIGVIAAALLALNGHQLRWMQAARMYEMALLLGLISTWLWVRMMRSRKPEPFTEAAFVIVTLLGVYSHTLFWTLLAAQMAFSIIGSSRSSGELTRPYFIQTLCVILGTPMWAHALYIGTAVNSGGAVTGGFFQDFVNFGFLYTPEVGDIAFWPKFGLTALAVICIAAFLTRREFDWERTESANIPAAKSLLPVAVGMQLVILAYALSASRRNALLAALSFAPLLLVCHLVLLQRFSHVTRWLRGRVPRMLSPAIVLPSIVALSLFAIGIVQPVAVSRAVLFAVPLLLIVFAGGLVAITEKSRAWGAVAMAIVLVASLGSLRASRNMYLVGDYRAAGAQLLEQLETGDLIFVKSRDWAVTPLYYYLPGQFDRIVASRYADAVAQKRPARIWIPVLEDGDPIPDGSEDALKAYRQTRTFSSSGIRLQLYERN